jgi:hypothetical protein
MHCEWKIVENIEWLERNVTQLLDRESSLKSRINASRAKNGSLFARVPPNVYRHLVLSDLKEVPAQVPEEFGSSASYSFDPLPPKNTIRSYTRPERRSNAEAPNELRPETLTSFFQSLLPSFNAENLRQNNLEAAGAANNNNNNNGLGMNQIVNRLREFLTAVEFTFPAEPVAAANQPNDNDDDENQLDEFD